MILKEKTMVHTTFYRKYRSQTFDEIIGQAHVVITLKNAIECDRLSHAYIFSGPRGTGKTSLARILAKSLNCRKGKSSSPCLTCDLCLKMAHGQSIDVIEIDAASNRGIDNIRNLNEQVRFMPVECLYKLYIIDEAHMLSNEAFNALLKTLEEPPAHIIFILATTEPNKIPLTIQSRCQHFVFRKLSHAELLGQLRFVSDKETISLSEKGFSLIARKAGGCMRDALSLLEQLYSFKGNSITDDEAYNLLGIAQFDTLRDLFSTFFDNRLQEAVRLLAKTLDSGIPITQLANETVQFLKRALFVKLRLPEITDLDSGHTEQLQELVQNALDEKMILLVEAFAKLEQELKTFPNPELLFQIRFLSLLQRFHGSSQQPSSPAPVKKITPPENISSDSHERENRPDMESPDPKARKYDPFSPELWDKCLMVIKNRKFDLYPVLAGSKLMEENSEDGLRILFSKRFPFLKEKLEESETKTFVAAIVKEIFGKPIPVHFELPKTDEASSQSDADINSILALFEGTIVKE